MKVWYDRDSDRPRRWRWCIGDVRRREGNCVVQPVRDHGGEDSREAAEAAAAEAMRLAGLGEGT